jgi:putative transposase
MCSVLSVSQSGYRAWTHGGPPHRTRLTDVQLLVLIQAIHAELKWAYGSPRIRMELRGWGFYAGKEHVEWLMCEHSISA